MPRAHRLSPPTAECCQAAGWLGPRVNALQRRTLGCDVARLGDRYALRAADLDRLPLPGCDQRAPAAAAHLQHVGRLGGVAMSSSMIVFLFFLVGATPQADTKISIAASVAYQPRVPVPELSAVDGAPTNAVAPCSARGGQIIGLVLLALDFVGGSSAGTRMSVRGALHDRISLIAWACWCRVGRPRRQLGLCWRG